MHGSDPVTVRKRRGRLGRRKENNPLTPKRARLPGSFLAQTPPKAERRRRRPAFSFISSGLHSASHWLRLARCRLLTAQAGKHLAFWVGGPGLQGLSSPVLPFGKDLRPCLYSEEQATLENYRFGAFPGLVEGKTLVLSPEMLRPAVNL